jgi:hypothetical protein
MPLANGDVITNISYVRSKQKRDIKWTLTYSFLEWQWKHPKSSNISGIYRNKSYRMTICLMCKKHMHIILNTILSHSFPLLIVDATMRLNANACAIVVPPSTIEINNTAMRLLNVPPFPFHTSYNPINKPSSFHLVVSATDPYPTQSDAY